MALELTLKPKVTLTLYSTPTSRVLRLHAHATVQLPLPPHFYYIAQGFRCFSLWSLGHIALVCVNTVHRVIKETCHSIEETKEEDGARVVISPPKVYPVT